MRITGQDTVNTISKPQTGGVFDSPKPSTSSGRAAQNAETSADRVDLGSQNGLVLQAQNASAGDREARVEQLRALVQSGNYEVDTNALSQSIVTAASNGY